MPDAPQPLAGTAERSARARAAERPLVFLYGLHPPPIGGVSIHLKRMIELLRRRGIPFRFAHPNESPGSPWPRLSPMRLFAAVLASRAKIVHVHGFGHRGQHAVLAALGLVFRRRVVITIHNKRFANEYHGLRGLRRALARICFLSTARVVVTSAPTDLLFVPARRVLHISPFLPPAQDELLLDALPAAVAELRRRNRILLCANASTIRFENGVDLYGLDHCVELMGRLHAAGEQEVAFVFALPEVQHADYLCRLRERIRILGIESHFLIVTEPLSFSALLTVADAFVRPTTTDGEALSLAEALYLGTFSIASDAVVRLEGTRLFRTRDLDDLEVRVRDVLREIRTGRRPERRDTSGGGDQILSLYEALRTGA